jgi:hypothetical protein
MDCATIKKLLSNYDPHVRCNADSRIETNLTLFPRDVELIQRLYYDFDLALLHSCKIFYIPSLFGELNKEVLSYLDTGSVSLARVRGYYYECFHRDIHHLERTLYIQHLDAKCQKEELQVHCRFDELCSLQKNVPSILPFSDI